MRRARRTSERNEPQSPTAVEESLMNNRMAALSISSVLLVLAAGWPATTSAQPAAAPAPLGAAEIREMFDELSNWGRWGENDQRGTLNLVTPAKRRQAAALVREGISVSLSQNLSTDRRSTTRGRCSSSCRRSQARRSPWTNGASSTMG
jgi:hypothetical protein